MRRPWLDLTLGVFFVACGSGDGGPAPTSAGDGGDGGGVTTIDDGGIPDAAPAEDATGDAALEDGGTPDAAAPDTGLVDAGQDADRPMVFAIIGDFGSDGPREAAVAAVVKSWSPEFIVTTGDNNYGAAGDGLPSFDLNIGKHYGDFIAPYAGKYWDASAPAAKNRFWPTIGNHDWDIDPPGVPYVAFFGLPGNERYYDITKGLVHFTFIDSDTREPDGTSSTSVQAAWAETTIKGSTSPFQLVFYHHPAYASGTVAAYMQWAFKSWGADAIVTGHLHNYERLLAGGVQYFINGQGGRDTAAFGTTAAGSILRYNAQDGAQRVTVTSTKATFQYFNVLGVLIDQVSIDPTGAVVP